MRILVTGASGTVGGEVLRQLLAAGHTVRALTRDPGRAGLPEAAEVLRGDLTAPETLTGVFENVDRLFLAPAFAVSATVNDVLVTATAAGLRRIVTLSSGAVVEDEPGYGDADYHHADEVTVEQAVEAAGVEWTHVRAGEFMANTLDWAPAIRTTGVVRSPFGKIASGMVHEADIAAVAIAALTEDGHHGAKYVLTGPELITPPEQVAAIGAAIGRDLRFEAISPDQARADWLAQGYGRTFVEWMLGPEDAPVSESDLVGAAELTDDVERVLNRPARTYARWAADHADDFR
ncbi:MULTISPECIES: NmrA family NAD(P)-binding protein [unclassified Crossiella]|uniref:NmrA family NAD(P)-binding protein n=1 Tax=unclassified Crossiella TaxID=2620835 RepID=UPI001FFFBEFD|nr:MULTISPECIES: NmrA family NAD(P)-binding protein [unclassified Crossiella]MCK2238677.1 NAD(P)H-binding protein [Crossiella sp. S99.2]MCK2251753.1 NAD(P)H-binding protein [Crossiella sp. S99.1]